MIGEEDSDIREELVELMGQYARMLADRIEFCRQVVEGLGMQESFLMTLESAELDAQNKFAESGESSKSALWKIMKLREKANAAEGFMAVEVWRAKERLDEISQ